MLKKIKHINFILKEKDNMFEEYRTEILNHWEQFIKNREDAQNEDVLTVSDIKEDNGDLRVVINWIKYCDIMYSKMKGNIKTRSVFSGGYVVTSDNYVCFAVDKNDSINLIGGMASKKDFVNSEYNPDKCIIREFKEEIGLDILKSGFYFRIKYLKLPNEEENKKFYYPVGLIYEIKADYTMKDFNNLFNTKKHDSELKSLIFLKNKEQNKLDKYTKKSYIDELYNLIKKNFER